MVSRDSSILRVINKICLRYVHTSSIHLLTFHQLVEFHTLLEKYKEMRIAGLITRLHKKFYEWGYFNFFFIYESAVDYYFTLKRLYACWRILLNINTQTTIHFGRKPLTFDLQLLWLTLIIDSSRIIHIKNLISQSDNVRELSPNQLHLRKPQVRTVAKTNKRLYPTFYCYAHVVNKRARL